MKMTLFVIAILVSMGLSSHGGAICAAEGCGLKPLKPLTPLGCKDLVPECRCDSQGRNCGWTWVCVPR